jgi:hypothetical protein
MVQQAQAPLPPAFSGTDEAMWWGVRLATSNGMANATDLPHRVIERSLTTLLLAQWPRWSVADSPERVSNACNSSVCFISASCLLAASCHLSHRGTNDVCPASSSLLLMPHSPIHQLRPANAQQRLVHVLTGYTTKCPAALVSARPKVGPAAPVSASPKVRSP